MKVNLKVLREDFAVFLRGVRKQGFLDQNQQFIIGRTEKTAGFYLLDEMSDSVYGHTYPLMEVAEDKPFWRICDADAFEEFIGNLPPNLNTVEFGTVASDSPYYFQVGKKPVQKEHLPLFVQPEGTGEVLTIARLRSIATEMYETLNQKAVPDELRRLFYTSGEGKHSFFALDGYKKIGFSFPSKGEDIERGAIFNPGSFAFFLAPMTDKSKASIINTEEAICWTHESRKATRIIASLHNKASLDILAKTKTIQTDTVSKIVNINLTADNFGKLLVQHRLKFNKSKSENSFYLWNLRLENKQIFDPSSDTSIEISNPEEVGEYSLKFAIPLTQIDWLVQAIQKGVKGHINIRTSRDSSNLIAIEFLQDTIRYEWLIPNIVNESYGTLREHANTIRAFRRKMMSEAKNPTPVKITIERNGDKNTFDLFPSNEGILISIDYKGIVMSILPTK